MTLAPGIIAACDGKFCADSAIACPLRLFRSHWPGLLTFATRVTGGDRQWAEDVAQETLYRAWRNASVLGGEEQLVRPWLYTVARRIAIDQMRARKGQLNEVELSGVQPADPADTAESVVTGLVVQDALATLSDPAREVVTELYLNGRTAVEVAGMLGIPEGTVRSRAHYAIRALRELVDSLY